MGTRRPKTEGTAKTYGQHIIFLSDRAKSFLGPRNSNTGDIKQASKDKIVEVIRNSKEIRENIDNFDVFGGINSFSKESKADLALAATRTEATKIGIPSKGKKITNSDRSISGQVFGNFSKNIENVEEKALILGSNTKTPEELRTILNNSKKIDLSISLRSKRSEIVQFSTMQTPDLRLSFTYNFFTKDEEDIKEQEDPEKDPLLIRDIFNVPRFVELEWDSVATIFPLSEQQGETLDVKKLKRKLFFEKQGVFSKSSELSKDNITKSNKKKNLSNFDGFSKKVEDVVSLKKGFSAICNQKLYKNTISTSINLTESEDSTSDLFLLED